ncbi:hypothetical protein [Deinococcus ruber]|uniref:Uncharacterized protein n=1 Tax=Deinococcus ruber TaxID=1848197 RepID=A0A918CM71_9DEIO|nr:hypothetical protein [Deinococcus ruber]GGR31440.1 hypothetical protein GCM10008957_47690 [Deinococcus ruber]
MTQPLTPEQLTTVLEMDFRAADLGDTDVQFAARLAYVAAAAVARADLTPPATNAQIEAGARYLLIGAEIRQLTRLAERQKSESGAEIQRDLATRLASLRLDLQTALVASGQAPARAGRQGSVSVDVVSVF